jgi:hypothetical protein
MNFYAYLWLREDGTPYYAGKGFGIRAFYRSRGVSRPPKDRMHIVLFYRQSEQEALETERELIANWGRRDLGTGCLHNHTDGGEGTSGRKHTAVELLKMSCAQKGRPHSPEHIAKVALNWVGRTHSSVSKAKMSASAHQRRATAETREKMSAAKQGRHFTEEHKAKISAAMMGNTHGRRKFHLSA